MSPVRNAASLGRRSNCRYVGTIASLTLQAHLNASRGGRADNGRVDEIAVLLSEIDHDGAVYVVDLDSRDEVACNADVTMDTASAFKIAVALEVCCRDVDPDSWLRIDAEKAPIKQGSVLQAIQLMMRLSDNFATDALLRLVGHENVIARLRSLGLVVTTVCRDVAGSLAVADDAVARAAGRTDWRNGADIRTDLMSLPPGTLGPVTTARELATLYALIWTDRAGPDSACAAVRAATGELRNRISLGFPGVRFLGKGGTFPGVIANDAGVLTFSDGRRYAIAVLTRARHAFAGESALDEQIGRIAAAAVNQLRSG
jgi:beta-lactamase class A